MTADTEKTPASKNTSCLICDASVGVSTRNSCPIFQQHVTTSDKPVYKIIGLVLDLEVQENLVHSVVVCKKCFKLLNEVDELQERITEIQLEVKGNYHKTLRKHDETLPPEEETDDHKSLLDTPRIKQGPGRPRLKRSQPEMKTPQPGVYGENSAGDDDVAILYSDHQKGQDLKMAKGKRKKTGKEKSEHEKYLAILRHRKFRANMTAEEVEKKKKRDCERYHRLKKENKIKMAKDMTPKELKAQRKKWKKQQASRRRRRKEKKTTLEASLQSLEASLQSLEAEDIPNSDENDRMNADIEFKVEIEENELFFC